MLPLVALLAACGAPLPTDTAPLASPEAIGATWDAVQPDGLLELVDATADAVPQGLSCPSVDIIDGIETWTGGCSLQDGTLILGRLQRYDGPDDAWVSGDRFAVLHEDGLDLYLDGSIEVQDQGELVHLDASATTCGAHVACADALVSLDLHYTLRLDDESQRVADATVRGFVSLDGDEPTAVEGAWRVDEQACELEPVDGIFAAHFAQRQTLELDGAVSCDGCAAWTVQGVDAPAWCPTPR